MGNFEIADRKELEAAICRLEKLDSEGQRPDSNEEYRLLLDAIEKYEDENVEVPLPDPIEAIQFRMDQGNLKAKDLIQYIGSASKVSEVLSGKRSLSKTMIAKLNEGLGIPLASLMGVREEPIDATREFEEVLKILERSIISSDCKLWDSDSRSIAPVMTAAESRNVSNSKIFCSTGLPTLAA